MSHLLALAGNQNCGKTTLFNALTGSNQHVGNFPGVTVEKKEGSIKKYKDAVLVDLPGIYSLSPYTSEEVVTRDFLVKDHPDAIINIVDATNLERNLYLTLQLMELNIPMILALNMMDEVRASGNTIHVKKLSQELGIPVIPISAAKGEGISDLLDTVIKTLKGDKALPRLDFCKGEVHRAIHSIAHIIEDHAPVSYTHLDVYKRQQLLVVLVVPDTVQPGVRLLFIHRRQLFCRQAALFDYLIQQFLVPKINLQILCQTFCNLMSATSKFSSYADDHFHFLLLVLFYPVFYPPPDHKTMVKSSILWSFGHLGQFVGLSSATFPLPLLYSPV